MSGRVDTSPAAVAERVDYWSHLFTADYPTRGALADACDLIHALAVERDRLAAEWAAERDGRKLPTVDEAVAIVEAGGRRVASVTVIDGTAPRTGFRRNWARYGADAWRHRTWTAYYAQRTERDGVNAWEVCHMRDYRRGCPGPFDTLSAAGNWIDNNANREYDR